MVITLLLLAILNSCIGPKSGMSDLHVNFELSQLACELEVLWCKVHQIVASLVSIA